MCWQSGRYDGDMKYFHRLGFCGLALCMTTSASAQDVAVLICDMNLGSNMLDQLALHGMTGTHYEDGSAPQLNQLLQHDVIIWSACSRLPAVETVVTNAYLAGVPVVVTAAYGEGIDGAGFGDWRAAGLDFLVTPRQGNFDPVMSLVPVVVGHPLIAGVNVYEGDTANWLHANVQMAFGTVVATWTNGTPLVVDVMPGMVYLNTWPPNNLLSNLYVKETSDEDVLLANAVSYAFTGGCAGDPLDSDGDGVADLCDACAGFDDNLDADGDFVPDGCDICPGGNDRVDRDEDGTPDDCDACPRDEFDDADGDGVCGDEDLCEGFDDALDDDLDIIPNDCDICFGTNPSGDDDGDGHCAAWDGEIHDCDPENATVYPGAPELCDGHDNACSGAIPTDELEVDGDGLRPCDGDCNDDDWQVKPGAPEICNGLDDDCDGLLLDGEDDADGDGFLGCEDDCDDANADVAPGEPETCDGLDNDCDGNADDDCSGGKGAGDCGCATGPGSSGWMWLGLLALIRRRRR